VIAEVQSIAGAATPGGAQIAAEEINAKGGVLGRKIEIVSYDNKSSSADSVRAFQQAVSEEKVAPVGFSGKTPTASAWAGVPGGAS
jgi:branched-chain amino acid transport system substrate-binding protein